jgi:drug/metabolite transporter (DMT)-like permease
VAVTAVWGSTFVIVKNAVSKMQVMDFLAWRFLVATAVMVAVRPRALRELDREGWLRGILLGLTLTGGYISQTFGLRYTSAAVSGFVTGLYVVLTPVLTGLLLRRRVPFVTWGAVGLATAGLAVISLQGGGSSSVLGIGLTIVCAACYALQIVGLGEWSGRHDVYALVVLQLLTTFVCCAAVAAPQSLAPPPDAGVWGAVVLTGVLATAIAFFIQTWAQTLLAPIRAAIVMTMEPVFAGVFAAIAGEHLSWRVLAGGALVLAAMYAVELAPGAAAPA